MKDFKEKLVENFAWKEFYKFEELFFIPIKSII